MNIKSFTLSSLIAATVMAGSVSAEEQRTVRIYNWIEYLPPVILEDFEKDTGIRPIYDVFDNAQMLESKLLTGNSGYDVAFPSTTTLAKFIAADAFEPLDHSLLPNWSHLDESIVASISESDPENKYSAPYLWGTTLLGYNKQKIAELLGPDVDMNSWDIIFKEENMKKLSECGVGFLDAPNEILPIALSYLELPSHSDQASDYDKAADLMLEIGPYVEYFNSSRYGMDLANGNICVGVGWAGGMDLARKIAIASGNGVEVGMALPKEGTPVWADVMVIPKNAQNTDEAHAFINYILRPDVIAKASNATGYPNPNKDATELVNEEIRNNPHMYVRDEDKQYLFPLKSVSLKTERMRTRTWNKIKSRL